MAGSRYVVWNGTTLAEYRWDGAHDCIVTVDNGLISVQRLRQFLQRCNVESILVFGCKAGQRAAEVNVPDAGWHGLATYCRLRALEADPFVTIRDLITGANRLASDMGFDQIAEVLCREDLLDRAYADFVRYRSPTLPIACDRSKTDEGALREGTTASLGHHPPEGNPVVLMHFDMCRAYGNPQDCVIDDSEFSP